MSQNKYIPIQKNAENTAIKSPFFSGILCIFGCFSNIKAVNALFLEIIIKRYYEAFT